MEYPKCQLLQNHADVFQQRLSKHIHMWLYHTCACEFHTDPDQLVLKWYWLNGTGPAEAKMYRSGTGLVLVGKSF